jgi:DNA-binding MarR family transcriptional regulator
VLGLIRERPGITVSEIAKETGVDAPSLYRVVRRLQAEGTINKEGRELRPV